MAKASRVHDDPMLEHLLVTYRSVGLFQDITYEEFASRVHEKLPTESQEWEEHWGEDADREALTELYREALTELLGFQYDHRYEGKEVLGLARSRLRQHGVDLVWGPEDVPERPVRLRPSRSNRLAWQRIIRLHVPGQPSLTWRYDTVGGLMEGVNRALDLANSPVCFVEFDTGGDYYQFVCVDRPIVDRLRRSPWFETDAELDPWAGIDTDTTFSPPKKLDGRWTVDGISLGMSQDDVVRRLGPASETGRRSWGYGKGPGAHTNVSFDDGGHVASVSGRRLEHDGKVVLRAGDPRSCVEGVLAGPDRASDDVRNYDSVGLEVGWTLEKLENPHYTVSRCSLKATEPMRSQ